MDSTHSSCFHTKIFSHNPLSVSKPPHDLTSKASIAMPISVWFISYHSHPSITIIYLTLRLVHLSHPFANQIQHFNILQRASKLHHPCHSFCTKRTTKRSLLWFIVLTSISTTQTLWNSIQTRKICLSCLDYTFWTNWAIQCNNIDPSFAIYIFLKLVQTTIAKYRSMVYHWRHCRRSRNGDENREIGQNTEWRNPVGGWFPVPDKAARTCDTVLLLFIWQLQSRSHSTVVSR